jgi:mannose-6-phosphate isomerase-like protein (cupin superfamily)
MVIEGDVELEVGKKKMHPKPREEVLIPAKVNHSVRNVGLSPSLWLYGYKR